MWKDIFISPDLTPNEQQASKVLCDELKKRRHQDETDLIIWNGKIIQRQRSSAPQS